MSETVICPKCGHTYHHVRGVLRCCEDGQPVLAPTRPPRAADAGGRDARWTCSHRGPVLGWLNGQTCQGNAAAEPLFACPHHGHVVRGVDCSNPPVLTCRKCEQNDLGWTAHVEPSKYVTAADLAADTLALCDRLPRIARVFGVARSGLIPASLIATTLGAELWSVDIHRNRVSQLGHGVRMRNVPTLEAGASLLVDDSVFNGTTLKLARKALADSIDCRPLTLAVYASPSGARHVDIYARAMREHVFEWNIGSPPFSSSTGFDLDGCLCRDFTEDEDDDGPRYLAAMQTMTPTRLRPRRPVAIITARLERYRSATETWLDAHGIAFRSLIMGPWETKAEREADDVAHWKACQINLNAIGTYVESDPHQAQRIHGIAGCTVVCPADQKLYIGKPRHVQTALGSDHRRAGDSIGGPGLCARGGRERRELGE